MFMNSLITVIVTIVSPPEGAGPSNKKLDFKQYFGRNKRQLIRITNNDTKCLFYALELARIFHDEKIINMLKKKGENIPKTFVTRWSFARILKNENRKRELVTKFMNCAKINPDKNGYGLEYLHKVQDFYDSFYPDMYRIVVIDGFAKVLWKGPMDRRYKISILFEDNHFHALKSIALYFKHKKFCIG